MLKRYILFRHQLNLAHCSYSRAMQGDKKDLKKPQHQKISEIKIVKHEKKQKFFFSSTCPSLGLGPLEVAKRLKALTRLQLSRNGSVPNLILFTHTTDFGPAARKKKHRRPRGRERRRKRTAGREGGGEGWCTVAQLCHLTPAARGVDELHRSLMAQFGQNYRLQPYALLTIQKTGSEILLIDSLT